MRVEITDPGHPHYGKRGELTGEVITLTGTGHKMAKVKFEDPHPYGTDACFVSKGQIARIRRRKT